MMAHRWHEQRGSALLLVLWAVVTMSLAVLGVVEYVQYNLAEATTLNRDFRVRQLAESGLALAMSPQIAEGDPLLEGRMDDDGEYSVRIHSESARLNINFLIRTGREDVVQRMFEVWKVPTSDARFVVQEIIGWMERTGEKPEEYAVEREFRSVAEMALVPGMDRVERRQLAWREAFTTWGDGRLDVNQAESPVLQAFFGIGGLRADRLVQYRLGADRKKDTLDDQKYEKMEIVAGALGFSPEQFASYSPLVTLDGGIARIESTGMLGDYKRTLRVVVNRKAQPAAIYLWEEVGL